MRKYEDARRVLRIRREDLPAHVAVWEGHDDSLVGMAEINGFEVAVYDEEQVLYTLVRRDGMTRQDAEEFLEHNMKGAKIGEANPVSVLLGRDLVSR